MKTLASLALTVALSASAAHADDATAVFNRVAPSVVSVLSRDENEHVDGHGSGVVIAPAQVVTNCHVVRDARSLQVQHGEKVLTARWQTADLPRDICLLEVPGLSAPALKRRTSNSLLTGERVFAVGNPLGFGLAVSEGLVSTITPSRDNRRIFISAALSPGSSGGGLFDQEGQLIGITTAVLGLGQNLNVAIPSEWIDEIASRGTPPPNLPEPPPAEPQWFTDAEALRTKADWKGLAELAQRWTAAQPKSQSAWLVLGLALRNLGRFGEAEKSLRIGIALYEKNISPRVELSVTLHQMGRKSEAERELQGIFSDYPVAVYPYHQLAKNRYLENHLDEAKQFAEQAILLGPGEVLSWVVLGDVEEKLGNQQAASRAFRIALRHRPNDPSLTAALARTLAASGQSERSREVIAQSPGAAKMSAGDWINIGYAESQRNRHSDAENAFRKALEIDPRSTNALANLALMQFKSGRREAAEASIDQALAIDPDNVPALSHRAERRTMDKNYSAARPLLDRIVALAPEQVTGWRWRGIVQFETQDYTGAAESYRRATALPAALAEDWLGLGNASLKSGAYPEAEKALTTAERMAPGNSNIQLSLASLYGNRGDNERALAYCERILAADPGLAQAWSSKGFALLRLSRFDDAVQALETAVTLQPDFANAWINLGHARLKQKQIGHSIRSLERAISLAPDAVDARFYLAQAYLASRQFSQARINLLKLSERLPNSPQVLVLTTALNLAEGKSTEAKASFLRMREMNPAAAEAFRRDAVAQGFPGANTLSD